MSLRIGMQLAFGLSSWLTWALALPGQQVVVRHAAHDNSGAVQQGDFQSAAEPWPLPTNVEGKD